MWLIRDFSKIIPDPEDSDSRTKSFQQVFEYSTLFRWPFDNFKICFIYLTQNSSRRRVSMSLISKESQVFISFLLSFHICHQHCQKKKQIASSSVQDIKRHLKKRATQSNKKSGHSGSPSSESSCSVVTKEDSCLLDDLLVNARFYIRMRATPQFTYFFPPFSGQRIQMTLHQRRHPQGNLPSPCQSASILNSRPAERSREKSRKQSEADPTVTKLHLVLLLFSVYFSILMLD